MASSTFIRHTIHGSNLVRRAKRQGAPKKPDEMKNDATIIVHTRKASKARFLEAKRKFDGMSQSAFGDLVIFYGLEKLDELFESNNCSKH